MDNEEISEIISGNIEITSNGILVINHSFLQSDKWDRLVWISVFGKTEEKKFTRFLIWEIAQSLGIKPSSINNLYMARGKGEVAHDFTVPAINIRVMAYDTARAVFKVASKLNSCAFIVEIARSEIGYTGQRPEEFSSVILGAAIKEGYKGPVFIQGDHFQAKAASPGVPAEGETEAIKKLTQEAIDAGFYNIDIDMSTLVDTEKESVQLQQQPNILSTLEVGKFIRSGQPSGVVISIGGEIGHIGGKNSTVEDFRVYMDGLLEKWGTDSALSKVSVQTGTHHGGVVLPNGSLADVKVDFGVLTDISRVARNVYGMGGAVQHGASTLPDNLFSQFPLSETLEIHLATGFQNLLLDHDSFPKDLLEKMYSWIDTEEGSEKKEGESVEQFHYKMRKKALGKFKKEIWEIDGGSRSEIRKTLEQKFEFLFGCLNVGNTKELVLGKIDMPDVHKSIDDFCKT